MSLAYIIWIERLAIFAIVLAVPLFVMAQDTVTVRGSEGELRQRSGLVLDVNGDRLILQVNEREQKIPFDQVVDYHTTVDSLAQEADRLYAERKYELAFAAYGKGNEASTPAWMRRRLLAGRVKSAVQMQAWSQATDDFLAIVNSDPRTQHFGDIPLVWTPSRPDAAVARKVQGWLGSQHKIEQLIGASHGLTDLNRDAALKILSRLSSDLDPRIAALATAQRWRAEPAPQSTTLRQWQAQIETMPEALRAGPIFVVGNGWMQNDSEQAALQLLRIPVLYAEQFGLAARALSQSADQLLKLNRTGEARIVLQELVDRHSGSAEADFAEKKLAALALVQDAKRP